VEDYWSWDERRLARLSSSFTTHRTKKAEEDPTTYPPSFPTGCNTTITIGEGQDSD